MELIINKCDSNYCMHFLYYAIVSLNHAIFFSNNVQFILKEMDSKACHVKKVNT